MGSTLEYGVQIPTSNHVVVPADTGRILALRSANNPKHNSGLFRILSSSVSGNVLFVDYRSQELPPTETVTIQWKIFENETLLPTWSTGSNGGTGYNSMGSATASRIMLNAPGGYHVRLCLESTVERASTNPCGFSVAPGAGSNSSTDFDFNNGNLLGPMWFNSTSSIYRGTAVGLVPAVTSSGQTTAWTTGQWRMTAIGDDTTGTLLAMIKNVTFVSGGNSMLALGFPEDEQLPISPNVIDRVFVAGYANMTQNINWSSGFFNDGNITAYSWSGRGFPNHCVLSSYCDIKNAQQHVRSLSTAADSAFTGMTELSDVDIIAGTFSSSVGYSQQPTVNQFTQKRFGRFPFARQGRSNYIQWALSSDKAWMHAMSGVYIPWGGPHLSGSPTGSIVAQTLTTSQASGDGIQFLDLFLPGSDPTVFVSSDPGVNKDANRFQKTYSYYRQPTISVRIAKGGSNPSKS
jgi:hypothetical protein